MAHSAFHRLSSVEASVPALARAGPQRNTPRQLSPSLIACDNSVAVLAGSMAEVIAPIHRAA